MPKKLRVIWLPSDISEPVPAAKAEHQRAEREREQQAVTDRGDEDRGDGGRGDERQREAVGRPEGAVADEAEEQRSDREPAGQPARAHAAVPQRGEAGDGVGDEDRPAGGDQQQRMLVGPVEAERRDQRAEQSAEHSADRSREVEHREMRRIGPPIEQGGMDRDRDQEQAGERDQGDRQRERGGIGEHGAGGDQQSEWRGAGDQPRGAAIGAKGDREAQQIEAERDHPQQRHGNDVGGQMERRREHQPRGHRRQRDPQRDVAARRRRRRDALARPGGARQQQGAAADEQEQQTVADAPQQALPGDGEQRLDEQRKGDQPEEAAEIGGGVKRVRVAAPGQREPALDQRRLRRDDQEQWADADEQQPRHSDEDIAVGRRGGIDQRDR
jgi:hypothetical protein